MSGDVLDLAVSIARRARNASSSRSHYAEQPALAERGNALVAGVAASEDLPITEGSARAEVNTRDSLYRRLLAGADALAAVMTLVLVAVVLGDDTLRPGALAVIPLVILVSKAVGLYDRDDSVLRKSTLDEAPALFRVATFYTFVFWLAQDALVGDYFAQDQLLALWVLLFVAMLAARTTARRLARALASEERCLIVGDGVTAEWVRRKLDATPSVKARVVGRVSLESARAGNGGPPSLGALSELESILAAHAVDRVIVVPGHAGGEQVLRAVRRVKAAGVKVSLLPRLLEVVGSSVEFDELDGVTLLGVRRHGLSRSSRALKRCVDLVGASLGLLVLAPLMPLVIVAIKLDSRGPVLFRQRRMGREDEVFEMLKFRTMVEDADQRKLELMGRNEAEGLFKIADDPRITRVGRTLRRTSLDELPQLINVLKGEMSLVGPRPLVVEEDRRVEGWQRRRLVVRPGITGLWQIFGAARIPLHEMVKIDYLYGANWSLWLDARILLRTIEFVLARRGL
jgi:exopolysaccharide biosynthesis polyprenyl glycosylphosphotransferase